ncbi:SDR family oxidoreductase [Abyssisolibacter fermentans]|uniref:SDR family oxidoreductase n=1 Tax=Abyssisolibacter fermentans TaxID=1766203 RepID=UPI00082D2E22|nr:SDR family oxidoreductase [Abyssisolibacter fermentans]
MDYFRSKISKDTSFLVTGGAGFIGSNIVGKLLDLGYKVRVLDNFSTGKKENINIFLKNNNFELIEGDIRNTDICLSSCNGIDYVLHQAALGSVPRSIKNPRTTNDVNITGSLNMMIAAKEYKIKRFIYASSSSVYGDESTLPKKEDKLGIPLSPYAITKKVNELYGKNICELYGLKTIGLRYFNVFGEKQDPNSIYSAVIPKFIIKLLNKKAPTIYGDGLQSRDFTYIGNVIEANLKACIAEDEAIGEVFNIACGKRITLIDLYNKICRYLNVDIKPKFTSERSGDVKHSLADISKANKLLKYNPVYDINTGLEKTIKWYKHGQ